MQGGRLLAKLQSFALHVKDELDGTCISCETTRCRTLGGLHSYLLLCLSRAPLLEFVTLRVPRVEDPKLECKHLKHLRLECAWLRWRRVSTALQTLDSLQSLDLECVNGHGPAVLDAIDIAEHRSLKAVRLKNVALARLNLPFGCATLLDCRVFVAYLPWLEVQGTNLFHAAINGFYAAYWLCRLIDFIEVFSGLTSLSVRGWPDTSRLQVSVDHCLPNLAALRLHGKCVRVHFAHAPCLKVLDIRASEWLTLATTNVLEEPLVHQLSSARFEWSKLGTERCPQCPEEACIIRVAMRLPGALFEVLQRTGDSSSRVRSSQASKLTFGSTAGETQWKFEPSVEELMDASDRFLHRQRVCKLSAEG